MLETVSVQPLAERCDEVWLVECDDQAQRVRLAGRGLSARDVKRRLAVQGSDLVVRLARLLEGRVAVRRLNTGGSLAETRETVEDLLADALEPALD